MNYKRRIKIKYFRYGYTHMTSVPPVLKIGHKYSISTIVETTITPVHIISGVHKIS